MPAVEASQALCGILVANRRLVEVSMRRVLEIDRSWEPLNNQRICCWAITDELDGLMRRGSVSSPRSGREAAKHTPGCAGMLRRSGWRIDLASGRPTVD